MPPNHRADIFIYEGSSRDIRLIINPSMTGKPAARGNRSIGNASMRRLISRHADIIER